MKQENQTQFRNWKTDLISQSPNLGSSSNGLDDIHGRFEAWDVHALARQEVSEPERLPGAVVIYSGGEKLNLDGFLADTHLVTEKRSVIR